MAGGPGELAGRAPPERQAVRACRRWWRAGRDRPDRGVAAAHMSGASVHPGSLKARRATARSPALGVASCGSWGPRLPVLPPAPATGHPRAEPSHSFLLRTGRTSGRAVAKETSVPTTHVCSSETAAWDPLPAARPIGASAAVRSLAPEGGADACPNRAGRAPPGAQVSCGERWPALSPSAPCGLQGASRVSGPGAFSRCRPGMRPAKPTPRCPVLVPVSVCFVLISCDPS